MNPSVLIIATRYDSASNCLYGWAEELRGFLLTSGNCDTCLMLDGESLCRSGSSLADAIERVDYVVFYGHGEKDCWIALPAGGQRVPVPTAPLVDVNNVKLLNGTTVYAACCYSLAALGPAFKLAFASHAPAPEFVGYKDAFNVHIANQQYFRDIVNQSILDFILDQRPVVDLHAYQKARWDQMDADFSFGGPLSFNPDAWVAAGSARANAVSFGFA
jgi:hypothetical protein